MSSISDIKYGHLKQSTIFFVGIKLDPLVNIHTIFYGKRMRIAMKILIFKRAKRFWTPVTLKKLRAFHFERKKKTHVMFSQLGN